MEGRMHSARSLCSLIVFSECGSLTFRILGPGMISEPVTSSGGTIFYLAADARKMGSSSSMSNVVLITLTVIELWSSSRTSYIIVPTPAFKIIVSTRLSCAT